MLILLKLSCSFLRFAFFCLTFLGGLSRMYYVSIFLTVKSYNSIFSRKGNTSI